MTTRLVIEDQARSGAMNMAIDEVLLDGAAAGDNATVRIYRWEEPTLSLGHFQRDFELSPELTGVPIVRRLSGGGAILHDRELTYSIALPSTHSFARKPRELYGPVHDAIRELLAGFGINTSPRGTMQWERENEFLCFGRGDAQDLLAAEHKVLGSAQRRRRGAVLQHGSLLLQHSPLAPQFPGVLDLSNTQMAAERLTVPLGERIAGVTDHQIESGELSTQELAEANLRASRYLVSDSSAEAIGPK